MNVNLKARNVRVGDRIHLVDGSSPTVINITHCGYGLKITLATGAAFYAREDQVMRVILPTYGTSS